jgi:hypothetical protein
VVQDPGNQSISLAQETDFQKAVRAAVTSGAGRAGIEQAAAAFAASAEFAGDVGSVPLGSKLDELADRLDVLEQGREVPWTAVATAIRTVFGRPASGVVALPQYSQTVRRLRDSLIAIKVLQQFHARPVERLARQLRTAELIADVAAGIGQNIAMGGNDGPKPETGPEAPEVTPGSRRRRSLALPIELD